MKYVYEFTNGRKVTKREFIQWFQKKVLYTIRKFGMIKKNDKIGYWKSNHFRGIVLEDVLKMFIEKAPVELIKLPSTKGTMIQLVRRLKIDKVVWASTTDLEADKIIHEIFEDDFSKLKEAGPVIELGVKSKIIKPLYLFLDKEVLLYAKLKKLKFKKIKTKKDKISRFIEELEKKHPEIKHSILKSYVELFG